MDATGWVILVIVVAVLVAAAVVVVGRQRRREQIHKDFGPEYQRVASERGDPREAEAELADRQRRRAKLDIHPLDPQARDRYAAAWQRTQARFVDAPEATISEADQLVNEVMRARGYPVEDFEQRAADVSVDHPVVVQHYRAGHAIAERHAGGKATTEDLRQAVVHYRELFDELLTDGRPAATDRDGHDGRDEQTTTRDERAMTDTVDTVDTADTADTADRDRTDTVDRAPPRST